MPGRVHPVGVLPQAGACLIHGHGATSAGWVSTEGHLELLLSAGRLPSQGCVFSLQGVELRGNKTSFTSAAAGGLISLQKPSQTSIIEQKTAKPAGEKQILCVRFVAIPLLFLISFQSCFFYLTTRGLFKNCWHNADDKFWSMTPWESAA